MSEFDPCAASLDLEFARRPAGHPARTLQRGARAGRVVRVRAGVFADPVAYRSTSSLERYRASIIAAVQTRARTPIICGESAAAIWGIPRVGRWPEEIELMSATGSRPHSRNGIRWRSPDADRSEILAVGGMVITDLCRTLADVARSRDFANAVVALDHGVKPWLAMPNGLGVLGVDPRRVLARAESLPNRRGLCGVRRAVAFCDPRAANAGESLSRVRIHELGYPSPDLQVAMPRSDGPPDVVDFDWPESELFGEFDGHGKYFDPAMQGGRSPRAILLAEKTREDRIRRRHRRFAVRWDWAALMRPEVLDTSLREAGLTTTRRPRR